MQGRVEWKGRIDMLEGGPEGHEMCYECVSISQTERTTLLEVEHEGKAEHEMADVF